MEVFLYSLVAPAEHNDQLPYCDGPVSVSGPRCHSWNGMDSSPLQILDACAHFPVGDPELWRCWRFNAVGGAREARPKRNNKVRCLTLIHLLRTRRKSVDFSINLLLMQTLVWKHKMIQREHLFVCSFVVKDDAKRVSFSDDCGFSRLVLSFK